MTFKDLTAKSYKLGVILQHGTAYELIDFLAHLQIVATARMAQDHAEQQMVQRALANELELDEVLRLQKIGRKRVTKTCRVGSSYQTSTWSWSRFSELEKATCVAKDMAVSNKQTRKQAKMAMELWQTSENRLTKLQLLQETGEPNLLGLPPLYCWEIGGTDFPTEKINMWELNRT